MKEKQEKKSQGILWRVLFTLIALVFLAILELGKHTILGWVLAVVVLASFFYLRPKPTQTSRLHSIARENNLFRAGRCRGLPYCYSIQGSELILLHRGPVVELLHEMYALLLQAVLQFAPAMNVLCFLLELADLLNFGDQSIIIIHVESFAKFTS